MPKSTHGFSLTELMVAIVILSVAIIPVAVVQTRSHRSVFDSGQYTEAVQLAQERMEIAKSQGFGNVFADSGLVDVYTWSLDVNNVSFGMDQLDITVSWQEKDTPRNVVISNLLSLR